MNAIKTDFIAIDTNVFMNLCDSEQEKFKHIPELLKKLMCRRCVLLVDDKRIPGEYETALYNYLRGKNLSDIEESLLRHWLDLGNWETVPVDDRDNLMKTIKKILPKLQDNYDRTFVYVAFKKGRTLITNDRNDLIDKNAKSKDGKMRKKLLKGTKKCRPGGRKDEANILCSQEAYRNIICIQP